MMMILSADISAHKKKEEGMHKDNAQKTDRKKKTNNHKKNPV